MEFSVSKQFTEAFATYEAEQNSVEAAAVALAATSGCAVSVVEADDNGVYEDDCFADLAA